MEPAFVSGVEQFVNKVMHSVVIHGRSVRIKNYSLTAIRPLTSSEWFLNHWGKAIGVMAFCARHLHFTFCSLLIGYFLSGAIYTVKYDSVLLSATFRTSLLCLKWNTVLSCFLHACSVLLQLMNSAASERKSNEFWSTCSPSPSYVLIQRCCHKLHKINSVQSVGPGWKHDSISNTTFLTETKRHEEEQWAELEMFGLIW